MIREGDGPEVPEEVKLTEDESDTKVNLDDAEERDEDDADGEREEKVVSKERDDQPRRKNGTWAERKAERGKDRKASKAWETERADYDRRLVQIREDGERQVRQLREEVDRMRSQGGQRGGNADPYAAKLTDLDAQLNQELKLIEQDPNHGYDRYRQLQDARSEVIAERKWHQLNEQQQRNQPAPNPYQARVPIIESEYPWTADPRMADLSRRAMAYRNYLIQVEGRPDTIDTDREALSTMQAKFGAQFGLQQPAPPSQRTRNLYAGPASRGTPRRGDDTDIPREVELGAMGNGHGLDPTTLARAVREAFRNGR